VSVSVSAASVAGASTPARTAIRPTAAPSRAAADDGRPMDLDVRTKPSTCPRCPAGASLPSPPVMRNQGTIEGRLRDRNPKSVRTVFDITVDRPHAARVPIEQPKERTAGLSIDRVTEPDPTRSRVLAHATNRTAPSHHHATRATRARRPRPEIAWLAARRTTTADAFPYLSILVRGAFRLDATDAPAHDRVEPPLLRHQRLRELPDDRSGSPHRVVRSLRLHPPPRLRSRATRR